MSIRPTTAAAPPRPQRATLAARLLDAALQLRLAAHRGELPDESPALAGAVLRLEALAADAAAVEREAAPYLRCRAFPRVPSPLAVANDAGFPGEGA